MFFKIESKVYTFDVSVISLYLKVFDIKQKPINCKGNKYSKKRFLLKKSYKKRFVNERSFDWFGSFRNLPVRFDMLDSHWLNWHYLALALILLKV